MALIQTDTSGLLALAAHCRAQADHIAALATAPTSAPINPFQPSAVAVAAAHTEIAAAGARMAARMSHTAAAATAAAHDTDNNGAADIAAVATTGI